MSDDDAIEQMHQAYSGLLSRIEEQGEWSDLTMLNSDVRKLLVLACASRFEKQVQEILLDWARETSRSDERIVSFVKARAIDRQYHTYFDWDTPNANRFFSMFGTEFKTTARAVVDTDDDLRTAIAAFIEIGQIRNKLVHSDFVTLPLDKTAEEVYALFQNAKRFISFVREQLADNAHRPDATG